MIKKPRFLRYGLRTAMLLFALLGVGFAVLAAYMRSPPNEVNQKTLDGLVARITTGMTIAQIRAVVGFGPSEPVRELSPAYTGRITWTFIVTDRDSYWHGNEVFFVGDFLVGKLMHGSLRAPY